MSTLVTGPARLAVSCSTTVVAARSFGMAQPRVGARRSQVRRLGAPHLRAVRRRCWDLTSYVILFSERKYRPAEV